MTPRLSPPSHHPPPEVLVAYASGTVGEDEGVLLACHLTVCAACRDAVAENERIVASLSMVAPTPVPDSVLASVLARLDESPPPAPPAAAPPHSGLPLPRPFLARYGAFERLPFRSVGRGVRVARLHAQSTHRAFVVDFPPGFAIPDHGHHGVERGLILRGGFEWEGKDYLAGDVSWQEDRHDGIVIDPAGPCTALFVSDGPLMVGARWVDRALDWWLLGR